MLETGHEKKFGDHVEALGCLYIKLVPWSHAGLPDRLVIGMRRFILFVEMKKPKGTRQKIQTWVHNLLSQYGFDVKTAYSWQEAVEIFDKAYSAHLKKEGLL